MIQCFLDTETTGVEKGACVIELAAIMVEDGNITETFHSYAKPSRAISKGAFAAHGISEEFLVNQPTERDMLEDFVEWFNGNGPVDQVLAYNAQFDVRIINDRLEMDYIMGTPLINKDKVFDVAALAKKAMADGFIPKKGRKWSQEYIANCLGIEYDAHCALEDVKAMMEIHKRLSKYYEVYNNERQNFNKILKS